MEQFQSFVSAHWADAKPGDKRWVVAVMGLAGEAGEVVEPLKKFFRDGKEPQGLLLELGDVLHYLTAIAHMHGYTLQQVADANIAKLAERWVRGHKEGAAHLLKTP